MVLPRIKNIVNKENFFLGTLVFDGSEMGKKAVKVLNLFSKTIKAELGDKPNVIFNEVSFKRRGEYKIIVAEDKITIDFSDYQGLRNALATISGLYDGNKLDCTEISDYPDSDFRSCLLDLARGYVEIDILKEHLVRLAKLKFSYVHLHLMDRQSYILKSDVVPNPDNHRQYTKEELRDVVEFCKLLSLEAIPEIEFPAHAVNLIKSVPELACDIIDMELAQKGVSDADSPRKHCYIDTERFVSSWSVCIGKESTYKIYEKIIDEVLEIFDSEYFHIGADEIEYRHLAAFPNWDNCHECKKLMDKYNGDILSIYYHGVRRMHEIVKSRGKKTIKWNESKECMHPIDLPEDIIIEYWFAGNQKDETKHINCFVDKGFKVINAHCHYTYVDVQNYMSAEKISSWKPISAEAHNGYVLGGEMCAWELGNSDYCFYEYTLPVCMALFSDRVWNNMETEYDNNYQTAIFSSVIGENKLNFNPLNLFEEVIPPRKKEVLEELKLKDENPNAILEALEKLKEIDESRCYGKLALKGFKSYLERLYKAVLEKEN